MTAGGATRAAPPPAPAPHTETVGHAPPYEKGL